MLIPNKGVIHGAHKIPIKLIQVAKSIFGCDRTIFELEEAAARSRLNVHDAAVNNTISVAQDPINRYNILLSCYFMASGAGHCDYKRFKYVSVGIFDFGPGG